MTSRLVIGMPVWNGEKYLAEALACLSAQGFEDMTILISDNASTDSTPDILSDFAARDKRIKFHRQTENIGAIRNYEWTLRNSESPYFAFAAFDDGWSPDYVESLWRCMESRPEILLSAPKVRMMDIAGNLGIIYPFEEKINDARGLDRVKMCLRHFNPSWFHGIFQRPAFVQAWDNSQRYKHVWGVDPIVMLPFLVKGAVAGSNDAVFYRRATGSSDEKYRPATAHAQMVLTCDFYAECLHILNMAPISAFEKAALLPEIFRYGRYGGKFRRVLRLALKGKAA